MPKVVDLLHDVGQGGRFVRRDDQQVDALPDEVLDVRDLLGVVRRRVAKMYFDRGYWSRPSWIRSFTAWREGSPLLAGDMPMTYVCISVVCEPATASEEIMSVSRTRGDRDRVLVVLPSYRVRPLVRPCSPWDFGGPAMLERLPSSAEVSGCIDGCSFFPLFSSDVAVDELPP